MSPTHALASVATTPNLSLTQHFDQPFYLIMNLAVGGRFPGNPDKTTVFPAEMSVDYVRVYERPNGYGEHLPPGNGKLPFEKI